MLPRTRLEGQTTVVPFCRHYLIAVNSSVVRVFMWCDSQNFLNYSIVLSFVLQYRAFLPLTGSRTVIGNLALQSDELWKLLALSDVTVEFHDHRTTSFRRQILGVYIGRHYWT